MKIRIILLLLIFFTFQRENFAQTTWPMPGAQWTYSQPQSGNVQTFSHTKDTLINSSTYQVIELVYATSWPVYSGSTYTRFSNDTVYRYVQSTEYPFLIFNTALNDVYTTFRTSYFNLNDTVCTSKLPLKVVQLDTLNMSTLVLRKWILQDTLLDDLIGIIDTWEVVERIGLLENFPFISIVPLYSDCSIYSDFGPPFFLCSYTDNSYSYSIPCAVSIGDLNKKQEIKLYPNPANDVLSISASGFNTDIEIHISNLMGQQIDHFYLFNEKHIYSTANLPAGFYFLKYSTPFYTQTTPFIINR